MSYFAVLFLVCIVYCKESRGSLTLPHKSMNSKYPDIGLVKSSNMKGLMSLRGGSILTEVSLPTVKVILQLSLTLFNVLCWAIPLKSQNFSQNTFYLGIANAFSCGIFLMLSFGHMIPHAVAELESLHMDSGIAFKFTLLGYLLIFSMEKIFFNSHSMLHSVTGGHSHGHSHGHSPVDIAGTTSPSVDHDHSHDHSHAAGQDHCEICDTIPATHTANSGRGSSLSPNAAVLLLLAMAIHSLFETMALGLASDIPSAIFMAASVGLHQPAESVALLVAFLKTSMSRAAIGRWLSLYSCIGPLGVSAGVLISRMSSPFFSAAIVAMTAGTFLYVAATEIITEEFEECEGVDKWARYAGLLSGVGLIYAVTRITESWDGHGHSHGHHHHHIHSHD
mmetsp:Transcript_41043/g.41927  ORF Transcript_41043/g.41927 Transcript_41043/m.41927 type:complete len:392 (-) Transcript_41043:152-1327(-)